MKCESRWSGQNLSCASAAGKAGFACAKPPADAFGSGRSTTGWLAGGWLTAGAAVAGDGVAPG
jgi:hypothetical protein